jgi:hypothetical protein
MDVVKLHIQDRVRMFQKGMNLKTQNPIFIFKMMKGDVASAETT